MAKSLNSRITASADLANIGDHTREPTKEDIRGELAKAETENARLLLALKQKGLIGFWPAGKVYQDNQRLRDAVKEYGQHTKQCDLSWNHRAQCTCGLKQVLQDSRQCDDTKEQE